MGDTLLWLLIVAGDAALVHWLIRDHKRRVHKNDRYYHNVYESIHQLNDRVVQLEELERMIQDLETCSSSLMKSIRIELPESLSNMKSGAAFLVNGKDNNSKYLLSIAYSEREKLRTSLRNDLENILRSGVRETVRETSDQNESIERGVRENG